MTMKLKMPSAAATILLVAMIPLLSGCFGVAAVGVGAGALMAADRRPTETYLTDEGIEIRAGNRIRERFGDKAHVTVTSYNRSMLLTGGVADAATRLAVEQLVSGVPNVRAVSNELQIAGAATYTSQGNDAYITTKIKARFVDSNKFAVNHVKVVTEAGVVYLMGIVTQSEAEASVEIARTTAGVLKVVRVFEIINDDLARKIDSSPPADAKPVKQ
jgi:osmotically-inducible protein OsmY